MILNTLNEDKVFLNLLSDFHNGFVIVKNTSYRRGDSY